MFNDRRISSAHLANPLAMSLSKGIATVAVLLGLSLSAGAAEPGIKAMLKDADAYRLAMESGRVETEVRTFKAGMQDKTRLYTVYLKPGHRSLVLFRSPAERGQKMLMLNDDYWLMMPASQRPLRITPMQKLLGEASTGDIATMTWGDDYDGTLLGEESIDGLPCVKLELTATRKGVSYPRIVLFLAKKGRHPVQAELYVASDKLAKIARFTMGEVEGRRQVTSMTLIDHLQKERSTEVHYLSRTARTLGDEYFNPAFLVRAEVPE
jgi:hypothetical protein